MYLWPQKDQNQTLESESSLGRVLTSNQFTCFRVIPHALWRWETLSEKLAPPGTVILPASFWTREKMDG